MERTSCDICSLPLSKPFTRHDHKFFPCRVAMCLTCGLVKLNPRWSEAKYQKFYAKKYDRFYRDPDKSAEELFAIDLEAKGKRMGERLKDIPLPAAVKMLDIGAGTGFAFFSLPPAVEVKAHAVEASPKCVPFLKSKGVAIVGDDFSADFGNGYDLIVARHVLEHVLDPRSFLSKIKNSLNKDGLLYLAVPNAMFFYQDKADSFFRHIHTYYFNLKTLLLICRMAGFQPLQANAGNELWAILKRSVNEGPPADPLPDISPADQLKIVQRYVASSRPPLRRRLMAIAKRLAYGTF